MYDHDNKRPRGFGFITFSTEEAVDGVFSGGTMQTLHDKPIEIKRAVPRDQMGPQTRGAVGGRGSYLASVSRSVGNPRPMGFSFPGAGFSPTGLSGRGYVGLGLGGLNGGVGGQDFTRASSDILTQMLANNTAGLANLAQSISQGLAAQGLGNGGSLGHQGLGLGQHNLMMGNQAQQQNLGNSALSAQMGRMSLGNGFPLGGGQQRSSAPAVSPTSASLRQNSLEEAFQGAFSLAPSMAEQQPRHLQSPQHLQSPGHLQQSPGHGSAFANSQVFNQGYRDDGAGLGTSAVSALSRDLSGAFSGSFTPHKESSMAPPEHQWSMSSV